MKLIAELYLNFIIIFLFIPFSFLLRLINFKKNPNTYFYNSISHKKNFKFNNINFISLYTLIIYFFLLPCSIYKKVLKKILFKKNYFRSDETPKQIASLISYKLLNNIELSKKIAEMHNSQYHFILQPSLFASKPSTNLDKRLREFSYKKLIDGFPYIDFHEEYYANLKEAFKNHHNLKNNFHDFSDVFSSNSEQRFVDPVHFGSLGQFDCAKLISEQIYNKENLNK